MLSEGASQPSVVDDLIQSDKVNSFPFRAAYQSGTRMLTFEAPKDSMGSGLGMTLKGTLDGFDGLYVASLSKDSPFFGKVLQGDRIIAVDGITLISADLSDGDALDLCRRAIRSAKDRVRLEVVRSTLLPITGIPHLDTSLQEMTDFSATKALIEGNTTDASKPNIVLTDADDTEPTKGIEPGSDGAKTAENSTVEEHSVSKTKSSQSQSQSQSDLPNSNATAGKKHPYVASETLAPPVDEWSKVRSSSCNELYASSRNTQPSPVASESYSRSGIFASRSSPSLTHLLSDEELGRRHLERKYPSLKLWDARTILHELCRTSNRQQLSDLRSALEPDCRGRHNTALHQYEMQWQDIDSHSNAGTMGGRSTTSLRPPSTLPRTPSREQMIARQQLFKLQRQASDRSMRFGARQQAHAAPKRPVSSAKDGTPKLPEPAPETDGTDDASNTLHGTLGGRVKVMQREYKPVPPRRVAELAAADSPSSPSKSGSLQHEAPVSADESALARGLATQDATVDTISMVSETNAGSAQPAQSLPSAWGGKQGGETFADDVAQLWSDMAEARLNLTMNGSKLKPTHAEEDPVGGEWDMASEAGFLFTHDSSEC